MKASLYDVGRRSIVGSSMSPTDEMPIASPRHGWAEQDPELWWHHVLQACANLRNQYPKDWNAVRAVGVAYQMHGLVTLDKDGRPVRPAIIWCDSRAVETGTRLTEDIGRQKLLHANLNTAGNFTASKMVWMMDHEKDLWHQVRTVMLPGDYIAYRMSGVLSTSRSGLSEMALWDFVLNKTDSLILNKYKELQQRLPEVIENIGVSSPLSTAIADELGLGRDVVMSYRSGDQPNNAYGLGVVDPGSVAMNAGTSGVVYAVSDRPIVDELEVFNPFLHVNDTDSDRRIGLLFCLNGCGILNAQIRRLTKANSYAVMNEMASNVSIGADGLRILPFGNGAERMLRNRNPGASVQGWDLVRHSDAHFFRASLEGIAASLTYGIEHMRNLGVEIHTVHAGHANLFISKPFCESVAAMAGVDIHLYESDGASAAAKGAAYGARLIDSSVKPADLLGTSVVYHPNKSNTDELAKIKNDYFVKINSTLK